MKTDNLTISPLGYINSLVTNGVTIDDLSKVIDFDVCTITKVPDGGCVIYLPTGDTTHYYNIVNTILETIDSEQIKLRTYLIDKFKLDVDIEQLAINNISQDDGIVIISVTIKDNNNEEV